MFKSKPVSIVDKTRYAQCYVKVSTSNLSKINDIRAYRQSGYFVIKFFQSFVNWQGNRLSHTNLRELQ